MYQSVPRQGPLASSHQEGPWRKRLTSAFSSKTGLSDLDSNKVVAAQKKASEIFVSATLRVVRSVAAGKLVKMLTKLKVRKDFKSKEPSFANMSELVIVQNKNPKDDHAKHIGRMAALLKQLCSMDAEMNKSLPSALLWRPWLCPTSNLSSYHQGAPWCGR